MMSEMKAQRDKYSNVRLFWIPESLHCTLIELSKDTVL